MRIRPPADRPPYRTVHSEIFEAGYLQLEAQYPHLVEAYDQIEWTMRRTPRASSEPTPAFPDRDMRLAYTPRTPRYPALRVLIEVDEGQDRVILWHLAVRA